jgi:hypothetical protein
MSGDKVTESNSTSHDINYTPWVQFKYLYSTVLLIFCTIVIMVTIANRKTKLSDEAHPAVAYVVIWAAVIWLSMVEGSQASLVGLPPVDKELYKDSHPTAYKITSVALKGDNLDRYLMGRQFMVLLIVFIINLAGSPGSDAEVFGFNDTFQEAFLGSGFAMIILTCNVGQLMAQVNASHCMIDYINNFFAVFTVATAMIIEFSGIMHASYLLQYAVAAMAGQPIVSKEDPKSGGAALFFYARCLMSVAICGFGFAVVFRSLFDGNTTFYENVPGGAALIIFFVLLSIVGMLEGMQIAFFAVAKLPKSEQGQGKFAKMTCKLLFKGNGKNLPGFMVGRQLCVVTCFFVAARVTTLKLKCVKELVDDECPKDGFDENVFGFPDGLQKFLETGLHAAVVVTIVGSISWQLVASAFPFMFLSNPLTYVLLVICLAFEATGVCCAAWFLALIHKKISGMQYDEVYIGTPEERVASGKGPEESIHNVPGSLAGGAFPQGTHRPGAGGQKLGDYEDTIHEPSA